MNPAFVCKDSRKSCKQNTVFRNSNKDYLFMWNPCWILAGSLQDPCGILASFWKILAEVCWHKNCVNNGVSFFVSTRWSCRKYGHIRVIDRKHGPPCWHNFCVNKPLQGFPKMLQGSGKDLAKSCKDLARTHKHPSMNCTCLLEFLLFFLRFRISLFGICRNVLVSLQHFSSSKNSTRNSTQHSDDGPWGTFCIALFLAVF